MRYIVSVLFALLLIGGASAEILLSQPSSVYNFGDNLKITANIISSQDTSSFFELGLNCGQEQNFYREFLQMKKGDKKSIDASLLLIPDFVGNNTDSCTITSDFGSEHAVGQIFKISDSINVGLTINELSVEAGKPVEINGNAVKFNGKNVDGFAELSINNDSILAGSDVKNGSFSINFSFPENAKSGDYPVNIVVFEKYQQEIINTGEANTVFDVKQTPKRIGIDSLQTLKPGDTLKVNVGIYDQADDLVSGMVGVKISNANGNLVEKIIESGGEIDFDTKTDYIPGEYSIDASSLGLENKRSFIVSELEKASFEIANNTLIVTNIGNVVYNKPLQILVGNTTTVKNIELAVGQSMRFQISAPDGSYNVEVSDGDALLKENGIALTGDAIGINEVTNGLGILTKYPIVWMFLIALFSVFAVLLYKKVGRKSSYSYPVEARKPEIKKEESLDNKLAYPVQASSGDAEHTVVLDGRKEQASIVAVKIRNFEQASKSENFNLIAGSIRENKGAVYKTQGFVIGLFSSATTRTFSNEMIAIKAANQIDSILRDSNSKFKIKIDYGIGVNSGEVIIKKDKTIKFTAIGNTLILSKKIADMAENKILISDQIQKKVMSEVRSEKEVMQGVDVYHIKKINEKQNYSDFIHGFIDRQKSGR